MNDTESPLLDKIVGAVGRKMALKDTGQTGRRSEKPVTTIPALLTPKETAEHLKLSTDWLAKARMNGGGPPYIKIGHAVRYSEAALLQWISDPRRVTSSTCANLTFRKRHPQFSEGAAVFPVIGVEQRQAGAGHL
jgi:hypothetical protein